MPVRYVLVAVCFSLSMLLYIDRIAISAAKGPIVAELGMDDTSFGWVLAAFALGYALFQAPAGVLVDRVGPRIVLAAVVTVWSVFTALTGLARGFGSLLASRFLFGAGEAGAYPTCARAFYGWLPPDERGFAQGINFSGSRLGAAFALPAVAWLIGTIGWRPSFLLLGAVGIAWATGWYLWFRDSPDEHPSVGAAERVRIQAGREAPARTAASTAPPRLWRSGAMWLVMGQYFASNFTFFFCLTWLFPHLQRTWQLDAVHTGLLASAPLVGGAIGNWVGGWTVDALYRRGLSMLSRRGPAIVGFVLAAIGLVGSLTAESPIPAVAWLALAIFGADMTLPPSWALCIDLGRTHAGVVAGTMNMAGNLGSFVTSLAFPYLLLATGAAWPFFIVGATLNLAAAFMWIPLKGDRPLTP